MSDLPAVDCSLHDARVHTDGDQLIARTGCVQRTWRWTQTGLATMQIIELASGRTRTAAVEQCDWQPLVTEDPTEARLIELTADVSDDEGFTTQHIAAAALIEYPTLGLTLRWVLWVYPDAPGLRTQLSVKAADDRYTQKADMSQGLPVDMHVEQVPIGAADCRRRFLGYYNATQQRNTTHENILKEEVIAHPLSYREWCDWASAACAEDDEGGIALVKESHKCVNQAGHTSGMFMCDQSRGLINTGWGMRPQEISTDTFTPGWATWTIVWTGGDLQREVAFKTFDKTRYPIDPARDVYVQANTWGSTTNGQDARLAATQDPVLKELESCADLGIDVLQIDDGWQVPPGNHTWQPEDNRWHPHPESYPDGWGPVKDRAAELGVRLGLWAAAQPVGLDQLKQNYTDGGFEQYKLDFAVLKKREEIDGLMNKVREFIEWTGHKVRVNWDVTENPARYGYFFAREYGCIYLENRKPQRPVGVIYRPHTVLRDLWQLSKYLNLHRFQCSIQNIDRVDPALSDAHLHSHAYATAIALMGIPLFFQQTRYYTDAARDQIRPLLATYKQHREAIYSGIVHPIGDRPDNASYTGFQCHLPGTDEGYLMLFRERCNHQPQHTYHLGWLDAGRIELTDLLTDQTTEAQLGADGALAIRIENAPGFGFLRYGVPRSPR